MARRKPTRLVTALVALVLVCQVLANENTCRTGCRGGANEIFKYSVGTTYKYDFESKIQISVSSAEGQHTGTEVKAKVFVTQQPDCNQVVRIEDIQIIGSDGKNYKGIENIQRPVVINYHDGHIEDHICTEPEDTQNSLNVKRAIVSLFQANVKHTHETDIFGLCPTEIATHKEGNNVIIDKRRNLNKCAYREHIKQEYLATAFNLDSEIKSSPILDADYTAKQNVRDGILTDATVTENYIFMPFSVGDKGAKAVVHTKIHLTGTGKDNINVKCNFPRSIIFENPHIVNNPKSNVNTILTAVKETVKTYDQTVNENSAKEFIDLIKVLRANKKDDLLAVYNQIRAGAGFPNKEVAKKVFLDALLRSVSGDTIDVSIELLKNNELSAVEEELVYVGFSFARHVSPHTIKAAAALLDQDRPRQAYLGIGTLVNRFCTEHSCKDVQPVHSIVQKLIAKLGDAKSTNRAEENDTIFILKALGNVHHINDAVSPKIISIAQNKKAPNRLRVAALETYVSDPCKDKLRDSALSILKDIQQDSEVRIKAYLAVAQCPNAKIGNAVKALLEHEPSYQVGGFIVSHIKNLRASANPDKQLAKQFLGFLNLPSRFPVDFRKWSFNGEFSYNIDSLGVGNYLESNVIYSQNSFLPRSSSFNLTTEVFGHTFNFLEIEARQENLDGFVEQYFGPKGVFGEDVDFQDVVNAGEDAYSSIVNKVEHAFRKIMGHKQKRDVSKADIEHMRKQIQVKTTHLNKDLDLDLSIKMFGAELAFISWFDTFNKFSPEAFIDRIVNKATSGVDALKHFDESYVSNLLWLDAELAYPTATGFPIRLAVEGSSAIKVNAAGSIDVRAIFNRREQTVAKVKFVPSANVEVAGRLTLDALVVENGLKVRSNLFTATGGEVIFDNFGYDKGFDIKFNFPLEKQTLVSARHEIVFHTREHAALERNVPIKFAQNKDFTVCVDQLNSMIGLNFCADFNGPNIAGKEIPPLPFPLSGDAHLAITIERKDLSSYHIRQENYNDANRLGTKFVIESLSKSNNKKVSLETELNMYPELSVKVGLVSPIKRISVEGRVINNAAEKAVIGRVLHDTHEYYARAGFNVVGNGDKQIYKPVFEYKSPRDQGVQISPYRVEGQIIRESTKPSSVKYVLDNVQLIAPSIRTVTVAGYVGYDGPSGYVDITATNGAHSGSLKGELELRDFVKGNAQMQNTIRPDYNFDIKAEFEPSKDFRSFSASFHCIHGRDLSSKTNQISFTTKNTFRTKSTPDFDISTKSKLTYPAHNLHVEVEFEQKPKTIEGEVKYECKHIKVGTEFGAHFDKKSKGDYNVEFEAWGFDNKVEFKVENEREGDKNKIYNVFKVNDKTAELKGEVIYIFRPQDINIGADLIVKIPTHAQPFDISFGFVLNPAQLDAHQKIACGGKVFWDSYLKVDQEINTNGAINVDIEKIINVDGKIQANKGTGKGHIIIECKKANRVVKADSVFTIAKPAYNVAFNIYPAFNENPDRKITVTSHNHISEQHVDTLNAIDVFGEKLEANAKVDKEGVWRNGKIGAEVEVILPNQRYVTGKFHKDYKEENDNVNVDATASIEHRKNRNVAGQRVGVKVQYKNCDFRKQIFDIIYTLAVDDANGRTFNADYSAQRVPQGDKYHAEIKGKLYGSVFKDPIEGILSADYKDYVGQYKAYTSIWKAVVADVHGNYDFSGEGRPYSGVVNYDVNTKSEQFKSLKGSISGSFKEPQGPKDSVEIHGKANIFAETNSPQPIDIKAEGSVTASAQDGEVQASINCAHHEPIGVRAHYKINEQKPGYGTARGEVGVNYGNKKWEASAEAQRNQATSSIDFKVHGPVGKETELEVKIVRNKENENEIKSEVVFTHEGKKWQVNGDVVVSEITPAIDIRYKCPAGKLHQFYAKVTKSNQKEFGGEVKIVNQRNNFLFESNIDANVENVEDFFVKVYLNSPAIRINKVTVEAHNKPDATGRRIYVSAKEAGKEIISGSTTYNAQEENGKLIIEGSGTFKVKEQSKSANFKYIRQNLSHEKHGERGIEVSFDAGLGNKAVDAELRVTNKQFRILHSYCEEKKECAYIEIDSKVTSKNVYDFNHEIEIALDLRKLGFTHEFGLKGVTSKNGYLWDHTVDVHFQSEQNSKYQYSIYVHPKQAGISLTTPKRIISLEATSEYPEARTAVGGRFNWEVCFYADKKNQPNHKTAVSATLLVDRETPQFGYIVTFTDPTISRPLEVSIYTKRTGSLGAEVTSTIDIFEDPNAAIHGFAKEYITITNDGVVYGSVSEIKSAGLRIDIKGTEEGRISRKEREAAFKYAVDYVVGDSKYDNVIDVVISPTVGEIYVKAINVDIVKARSHLTHPESSHYLISTDVHGYGFKPIASEFSVKNWNNVDFFIYPKDQPSEKYSTHTSVIFGKGAEFWAAVPKGKVAQASVKLDQANFLQSTYHVNSQLIKEVGEFIRDRVITYVREIKALTGKASEAINKELDNVVRVASVKPNIRPVVDYYIKEARQIKEEIEADKTIQNIGEIIQKIAGIIIQNIGESIDKFSRVIEDIAKVFHDFFGKAIKITQRDIIPNIKHIIEQFADLAGEIFSNAIDVSVAIIAKIGTILEGFQPEFEEIAKLVGNIANEVTKAIVHVYSGIRDVIEKNGKKIYEDIKKSHVYEEGSKIFHEYVARWIPSQQAVLYTFKDLMATLRESSPTPEFKKFFQLISDYVEKKVTGKPCDDVKEIETIIQTGADGVRKIIAAFLESGDLPELQNFELPDFTRVWSRLPRLAAIRFSPITYLVKNDITGVAEFILSLFNHPRYWFPPYPLNAIIVQGQHIFTFDGKHITFPGKCSYLLVGDAVHNHFTVYGEYVNGFITSITVDDGTNSVSYKKSGHATYNNAPTEMPRRSPDLSIAVYREYGAAYLESKAGVKVICSTDLSVCAITVSGFYHGHLKGLLGNGNNEPYDDFIEPSGKIVANEGNFANSYKMSQSCPNVKVVDHKVHQSTPSCSKLFSEESQLRLCYPFVNPENYKIACEHGVAAGVKDTEKSVAFGYVAACSHRNIPVYVPKEFLKCENGHKPRQIGDTFKVKTPAKSADVVIIVDTVTENEAIYKELIQPAAQQLTNELHAKGISDIEYHVIAYGGQENRWPSHVTAGGKLQYKGKLPSLKFTEPREERIEFSSRHSFPLSHKFYNTISRTAYDFDLVIGNHLPAKAYKQAIRYPFRAEAVKSIIVVASKPCEIGAFLPFQIVASLFYKNEDINLNLFTPARFIELKDTKHTRDIVGFNDHAIYTIAGAKKHPFGTSELYKDLVYNDYCIDFTIKNKGNVFITDNFVRAKPPHKKQYTQIASHNIASLLTGIERELECECEYYNQYGARNKCDVIDIKDNRGSKGVKA